MSFSQKSCPAPFPPVSCSRPTMLPLLEGQPENSWPLGGKYCITSSPSRCSGLHFPYFLQHMQQQHLSVDPLGRMTGTQCLLEVHLLASLQRQLGFQGEFLPLRELAPQTIWAQTLTTLLLKLQTYPRIKSPLHFYGASDLLLLINLLLSHFLTPATRTLPPCRQLIKIPRFVLTSAAHILKYPDY